MSSRWDEIKELVAAALEQPREAREEFVTTRCNGDESLRREVDSLLSSYEEAGEFLDTPVLPGAARMIASVTESGDPWIGRSIGPYVIEDRIGEGGMGVVYRATRREEDLPLTVAVKLVRRGMNTDAILKRFRAERRILARLVHPNIGRLLDGGATEDGLPYFVLEFVSGTPLDRYANERQLGLRERLQLMERICGAVHYAHQNLVVHGDLKASNILVGEDGEPKLLDFGIARVLGGDSGANETTATLLRAATPEVASPEHLRGQPLTTASDVYSLGIVLYQLLAGRHPYELPSRQMEAVLDVISTQEPRRASVLSGDKRLAGDLDNILLKAIAKDPAERYSSVELLAEDLRRYQEGYPVAARAPKWTYRTARFLRRNWVAATAVVAVVVSLAGGVLVSTHQARLAQEQRVLAERRFQDLRRLAASLISDMDEAIAPMPGATAARAALVEKSLRYLDNLSKEAAGDPALQADLATAYIKMGDIQGRPNAPNLGNTAGAFESYRKGLAIREILMKDNPGNRGMREMVALTYNRMSAILRAAGSHQGGLDYDLKALHLRERNVSEEPDNRRYRRALAASYTQLGAAYLLVGDNQGMHDARERALAMHEVLVRDKGASLDDHLGYGLALTRVAGVHVTEKKLNEALTDYQRALAVYEVLVREHPNDSRVLVSRASVRQQLAGALTDAGRYAEAAEMARQAIEAFSILSKVDPDDARNRSFLASSYGHLGRALLAGGKPAEALEAFEQSYLLREALAKADTLNAGAQGEWAIGYAALGDAHRALGHRNRTRFYYESGARILRDMASAGRSNPAMQAELERIEAALRLP
jgi:non-specific serine/threonine protein kinase/serine/threonine-protein kinase